MATRNSFSKERIFLDDDGVTSHSLKPSHMIVTTLGSSIPPKDIKTKNNIVYTFIYRTFLKLQLLNFE